VTLKRADLIHQGRIVRLEQHTVEFPDGSEGTLDVVRHPGAAAVVPFLDDPAVQDPRILLIRHFRHAAGGWLWEIPAGKLDAGEQAHPERCAHRELQEETGYSAESVTHLLSIVTTPGFSDEVIHLYMATGLNKGQHSREADEFMELHEFSLSKVNNMIRNKEITDGKSLVALLFVLNFRRGTQG
jgi:ADP-ribose pyrophosphatase